MTVRDLIDELENFDEDMPVCIGMMQTYGSNFSMQIVEVDEYVVGDWDHGKEEYVVLTEGRQFGTVKYDD